MKRVSGTFALFCLSLIAYAQTDQKFSLQINYGINGNYSVRAYDEIYGPDIHEYFYKKDFLGTIRGMSIDYRLDKRSVILAEYSRSIHKGRKNFVGRLRGGAEASIRDFQLSYIGQICQLGYGYKVRVKKSSLILDAGVMLTYDTDQSITIEGYEAIFINETNYRNSNSVQGGVFIGMGWTRKIDTRFSLGIKSRIYYMISTQRLEAIALTPTLNYHF